MALVDGVEDIQFSYGCDGCNSGAPNPALPDGIVDQQSGGGLSASGPSISDFVTNSAWNVTPMTPDKIKQVRVTIVARQLQTDGGFGEVSASGVEYKRPGDRERSQSVRGPRLQRHHLFKITAPCGDQNYSAEKPIVAMNIEAKDASMISERGEKISAVWHC